MTILDLMKHKASRGRWFIKNGNFQERFLEMYFYVISTHVTDTQDWLRPLRHMISSQSCRIPYPWNGFSTISLRRTFPHWWSLLFYVLLLLSFSLFTFENFPSLKRTCRSRSVCCSYSRLGTNSTTDCLVVSTVSRAEKIESKSRRSPCDVSMTSISLFANFFQCVYLPLRTSERSFFRSTLISMTGQSRTHIRFWLLMKYEEELHNFMNTMVFYIFEIYRKMSKSFIPRFTS